jgi:hypothetical protein
MTSDRPLLYDVVRLTGPPLKFITHSYRVQELARRRGWLPGARYTNLRDVKRLDGLGFLDIDWRNYSFRRHLEATKTTRPFLTVARDIEDEVRLAQTIYEADELLQYAQHVVIVPKDVRLENEIERRIPKRFILGFSVPTKYGGTMISPQAFKRPVHLLGGRPDVQRRFAESLKVFSIDCNRFTLDAGFGDYFDGEIFRPHPVGGYERCLVDSLINIDALWADYRRPRLKGSHPWHSGTL